MKNYTDEELDEALLRTIPENFNLDAPQTERELKAVVYQLNARSEQNKMFAGLLIILTTAAIVAWRVIR